MTEFLFKPADGEDPNDEWVEIFNNCCSPIDLTGWRIGDVSKTNDLLPISDGENLIMLPNAYAVLIPGQSGLSFTDGTNVFHIGEGVMFGSNLNDNFDSIFLYDDDGNEMDSIRYNCDTTNSGFQNCSSGGNFPAGNTLERKNAGDNTSFEPQNNPSPGVENAGFSGDTDCTTHP